MKREREGGYPPPVHHFPPSPPSSSAHTLFLEKRECIEAVDINGKRAWRLAARRHMYVQKKIGSTARQTAFRIEASDLSDPTPHVSELRNPPLDKTNPHLYGTL